MMVVPLYYPPTLKPQPHNLVRLYPRLMKRCRSLGVQPEALEVERYASMVSELLADLDRPRLGGADVAAAAAAAAVVDLDDIDALLGIAASVVQEEGGVPEPSSSSSPAAVIHLDSVGLERFQRHCARLLSAGVRLGFIRQRVWSQVLDLLARAGAPCPQLCGAVALALTHGSAPFGEGAGFQSTAAMFCRLLRCSGLGGGGGAPVGGGGQFSLPAVSCSVDVLALSKCLDASGSDGSAAAVQEWCFRMDELIKRAVVGTSPETM
jgi:hypothetical protein